MDNYKAVARVLNVTDDCRVNTMRYRFYRTREDADEPGWYIAHDDDQTTWRCEVCNFINDSHQDFCGFCGANHDGDLPAEYGVNPEQEEKE